jgi:ribosomal protein L37E
MVHKGCERCGGDLFEEEFLDSTDLVCLQCGYRQALTPPIGREQETRRTRWTQLVRPSRAA